VELETFRTLRKNRGERLDPLSVEGGVRQLLADKISGNLGGLRRARGDFRGHLLAIDPHRLPSSSKRQMPRYRDNTAIRPYKVSSTFFCLDVETHQPICFLLAPSSMTATQMTPRLLHLAALILNPDADSKPLVLADNTILVTLYNAPEPCLLRKHYENLPKILEHENIDPRIPWLYNFKLDFRLCNFLPGVRFAAL
jgi:hypothetical protein